MYSQYVFIGVALHTARIACWFSKATTHWSNFCTRDGIDSQTVLQTIHESKTGSYVMPIDVGHKFNNALTFKIENENDLHIKVVSFLKKRFPHSIFVTALGENQDTSIKRIGSFNKGYMKGTPDLIINNLHKYYTGFAIEFKTPKGYGSLSNEQSNILFHYQLNGFKTLVSNDYDHIIEQIIEYFRDVRMLCLYCPRRFISSLNH